MAAHEGDLFSFTKLVNINSSVFNVRLILQEVGYLHRVLSETLHEADVQAIFR